MSIKDIIQGKKKWREHMSHVKALPKDYQIVYKRFKNISLRSALLS